MPKPPLLFVLELYIRLVKRALVFLKRGISQRFTQVTSLRATCNTFGPVHTLIFKNLATIIIALFRALVSSGFELSFNFMLIYRLQFCVHFEIRLLCQILQFSNQLFFPCFQDLKQLFKISFYSILVDKARKIFA